MTFAEIYAKHHPGILRYLARLVGRDEAEDVAQEVFLKVDRGLKDFRGEASVATWVYRIARNAALDRLRARPQRDRNAEEAEDFLADASPREACSGLPDGQPSVERVLAGKEMGECVRGRVESLPRAHRDVLVMSELAGLTNAEIASRLGTSEGAVKIRLHRARTMLRKELGTHCTLYCDDRGEVACEPAPAPR